MANKSGKGSSFERLLCKTFSLWFSEGTRDDLYWRTSQSGGRATTRFKSGKRTEGQYGDVTCVDPDGYGSALTKCFTIEAKKGYGRWNLLDLICKKTGQNHPFVLFWKQVVGDWKKAGTMWPMLVAGRHACEPIVILPWEAWKFLHPRTRNRKAFRYWDSEHHKFSSLMVVPLSEFLKCDPKDLTMLIEERR